MNDHALYLNLGENNWVIARCGCDGWRQERMLKQGERPSEVVRELEEEFERHAGRNPFPAYTPALPTG
jgi:hypothetical protein